MSEGRTYRCGWKKEDDGTYGVWLEKTPAIRGAGATVDDAVAAMGDIIIDRWGDGEPQFEFDPPLPVPSDAEVLKRVDKDTLVQIYPNGGMNVNNPPGMLYSGSVCDVCGMRANPVRTDDILMVRLHSASATGSDQDRDHLFVLSMDFLSLLTTEEKQSFETRPIILPPKTRRKVVEIVPKKVYPETSLRGIPRSGGHCTTCGCMAVGHGNEINWASVLCRSDLPDPLPSLFFSGRPNYFHICMTRRRWAELKGKPGTSAWTSSRVFVAAQEDCTNEPPPKTVKELRDEADQMYKAYLAGRENGQM